MFVSSSLTIYIYIMLFISIESSEKSLMILPLRKHVKCHSLKCTKLSTAIKILKKWQKKKMFSNSVNLFFKRENEIINRYLWIERASTFLLLRAPTSLHLALYVKVIIKKLIITIFRKLFLIWFFTHSMWRVIVSILLIKNWHIFRIFELASQIISRVEILIGV